MESPFLYEQALSAQDHLIIPFQYGQAGGYPIYSYALLSAQGHRGTLHQAVNPAALYSSTLSGILDIAQEHLVNTVCDRPQSSHSRQSDTFRQRYVYRGHLLIVGELRGKYFYDHYAPHELRNIAAPKLFISEPECLSWIKLGLDRRPARS